MASASVRHRTSRHLLRTGRVKDLHFDDHDWTIRYLIADTGTCLTSRTVLIKTGLVDDRRHDRPEQIAPAIHLRASDIGRPLANAIQGVVIAFARKPGSRLRKAWSGFD